MNPILLSLKYVYLVLHFTCSFTFTSKERGRKHNNKNPEQKTKAETTQHNSGLHIPTIQMHVSNISQHGNVFIHVCNTLVKEKWEKYAVNKSKYINKYLKNIKKEKERILIAVSVKP